MKKHTCTLFPEFQFTIINMVAITQPLIISKNIQIYYMADLTYI